MSSSRFICISLGFSLGNPPRSQGSESSTKFLRLVPSQQQGRDRHVSRIPGTVGRILASFLTATEPPRTCRGRTCCRLPAFSLWFFHAWCLHKGRNWVTMNEQCSWCSREGGLGNSSRSSSPDLAGIKGGLESRSVPRLGKTQKDKKKKFFLKLCI